MSSTNRNDRDDHAEVLDARRTVTELCEHDVGDIRVDPHHPLILVAETLLQQVSVPIGDPVRDAVPDALQPSVVDRGLHPALDRIRDRTPQTDTVDEFPDVLSNLVRIAQPRGRAEREHLFYSSFLARVAVQLVDIRAPIRHASTARLPPKVFEGVDAVIGAILV